MDEITIKLTFDQWNQLLGFVAEAPMPWRMTNPLIGEISKQVMAQRPPQPGVLPLGNGQTDRPHATD